MQSANHKYLKYLFSYNFFFGFNVLLNTKSEQKVIKKQVLQFVSGVFEL